MTLEQLLDNHRRAQANAAQSNGSSERETYFDLVAYYAKRIRAARKNPKA